jgi:hypothetical protein
MHHHRGHPTPHPSRISPCAALVHCFANAPYGLMHHPLGHLAPHPLRISLYMGFGALLRIASRMHPTVERCGWALFCVSVDGGIGPISGSFNQPMLHRIVVNVFAMVDKVLLITNAMFPIATLPKVAFSSPFTGWGFL